ncbi:hypothetical protein [Chishuiella sp.]|uniref:hypothetical protein n=1 Tax=Chishuiella sp. TaxID=1969467 RepID=UPI0028A7FC41|nr:hypothetical protein [Chishuiella sp.]
MKKKINIYLFLLLTLSCNNQKSLKNEQNVNKQKMFSHKVTIQDLERSTPITIKTDNGYQDVYNVIIYTSSPSDLVTNGISVQSTTSKFVTALIKKEDLEKIYKIKSVKSISLPGIDLLHENTIK